MGHSFVKNCESDTVKRMGLDLETLRGEVQAYLDEADIAVFYGYHRAVDTLNHVFWDTELHPDFREFLTAARKAGAKVIVFHHEAFSLHQIDEALEQLEDSNLTRDEKRVFETRLRQLRDYEGFTCSLELSFAVDGQIYRYELFTEWFEALNEVLAELEAATAEEEEEDDGSLGGYFSKN